MPNNPNRFPKQVKHHETGQCRTAQSPRDYVNLQACGYQDLEPVPAAAKPTAKPDTAK